MDDQNQKPLVKTYCGGKPNYCTPEEEHMTKEDIIRMAREAGFADGVAEIVGLEGFARFAALVAAAEREACAKVCEDEIKRVKPIYSVVAENVLKAIRARGQT